ncbi:MAG: hypothetical protein AB2693_21140, partial [Candidatus Thiodiazotropha sp.]
PLPPPQTTEFEICIFIYSASSQFCPVVARFPHRVGGNRERPILSRKSFTIAKITFSIAEMAIFGNRKLVFWQS